MAEIVAMGAVEAGAMVEVVVEVSTEVLLAQNQLK
jgi:hypothetical protein